MMAALSIREAARTGFLRQIGWGGARVSLLAADASFRRYFRARQGEASLVIMDAPPEREATGPFVAIARHLHALGLQAPQIIAHDAAAGFVALEDFGDDTYSRLLAQGADEQALYEAAIDVLVRLHGLPGATGIDLPDYDEPELRREAGLLADWYLPWRGGSLTADQRAAFDAAWQAALAPVAGDRRALVLRDFHVDNLMRLGDGSCGLLDFQDARIGHPAYDLMSLLEDARRDPDPALVAVMRARYGDHGAGFERAYDLLALQRHAKVLGIFVRLSVRDGKDRYLAHLPRVERLFRAALARARPPALTDWLQTHLPHLT